MRSLDLRTPRRRGSVLAFVLVAVVIFAMLGTTLLTITYGVRARAIRFKNETIAMLAAEAGYEQALLWMGQQPDVLNSLASGPAAGSGTLTFTDSSTTYAVTFEKFIRSRPIFRVLCIGTCGNAKRVVDCLVMQAIDGWAMAKCRIPDGTSSDVPVYFASGENIDMPICINKLDDSPDEKDIYISGTPTFTRRVSMGEAKGNKYSAATMACFDGGIIFGQPKLRITDPCAVQQKLARFKSFTKPEFIITPQPAVAALASGAAYQASAVVPAVQIEFYIPQAGPQAGKGCVRITNNCTVICTRRTGATLDYCIPDPCNPNTYAKYDIYGWHYRYDPDYGSPLPDSIPTAKLVTDTYVQQVFAGIPSDPGGQIFINGNVVIGGAIDPSVNALDPQVLQGKLTIVATGNIWIADSILVAGNRTAGRPAQDNPNVLGLIAGGVVKVIDPGLCSCAQDNANGRPGPPVSPRVEGSYQFLYAPVANSAAVGRTLPNPMIVEAAVIVGGGGWGAEGVSPTGSANGRRGSSEPSDVDTNAQDFLELHGAICEVVRGVVGKIGADGYLKQYYMDDRLLEGVLPGNIWFGGRYIPAPAGWQDYRQ